MYTFINREISCLYKDVFGVRPPSEYLRWWESLTDDDKEDEWVSLLETMIA